MSTTSACSKSSSLATWNNRATKSQNLDLWHLTRRRPLGRVSPPSLMPASMATMRKCKHMPASLVASKGCSGQARASHPPTTTPKNLKRLVAILWALQLVAALHAEERCPVEVKLLLPTSTTDTVVASLGFADETHTRVYLFDTEAIDLLKQGVIIRFREGAKNDLTVKVRLPKEKQKIDNSRSSERFPCEVDRTKSGASTSYAVAQKYKAVKAPQNGDEIHNLLNDSQIRLLQEAQVSIDWARVMRMATINATKWETPAQSPSGGLALELWEWPAGKVLELSAKVESEAETAKLADLERLLRMKDLPLSASQDTKTNMVLEAMANQISHRPGVR
jgi:hypothetical protein